MIHDSYHLIEGARIGGEDSGVEILEDEDWYLGRGFTFTLRFSHSDFVFIAGADGWGGMVVLRNQCGAASARLVQVALGSLGWMAGFEWGVFFPSFCSYCITGADS